MAEAVAAAAALTPEEEAEEAGAFLPLQALDDPPPAPLTIPGIFLFGATAKQRRRRLRHRYRLIQTITRLAVYSLYLCTLVMQR